MEGGREEESTAKEIGQMKEGESICNERVQGRKVGRGGHEERGEAE